MNELKEDLQKLAIALQEVFKCPVCHYDLDTLHWLCNNGHGVCNECKSRLEHCPTCQGNFVLQKATLLNQILDLIPKPCSNKGCTEIIISREHETFCQFRLTDCKKNNCKWKGCVKDLFDHMFVCNESYSVRLQLSENYCKSEKKILNHYFDKCNIYFSHTLLVFKDNLFWMYCCRDNLSKRITHRFFFLPTSKRTHNYYLSVSFIQGLIEFKTTSKAYINLEKYNDDVNSNDSSVVISDSDLSLFLSGRGSYEICIQIMEEKF